MKGINAINLAEIKGEVREDICSIRRRREETPSKHKLARGLFKMADLQPSMQCKPNPTSPP